MTCRAVVKGRQCPVRRANAQTIGAEASSDLIAKIRAFVDQEAMRFAGR